jgi:hypothetical protein
MGCLGQDYRSVKLVDEYSSNLLAYTTNTTMAARTACISEPLKHTDGHNAPLAGSIAMAGGRISIILSGYQ